MIKQNHYNNKFFICLIYHKVNLFEFGQVYMPVFYFIFPKFYYLWNICNNEELMQDASEAV